MSSAHLHYAAIHVDRVLHNIEKAPGNPEAFYRADEQIRTADLLITNEVRYHLCHVSLFSSAFSADAL